MADIDIDVQARAASAISVLDKVKAKVSGLGDAGSKVKLLDPSGVARQASAAGDSAGRGFTSKLKSSVSGAGDVFKGVLGAGAVGAAVGAAGEGFRQLTGLVKDSVGEARESQKVGAQTAQVIKTTGGAARVSAGDVGKLATAISNKSGVDDEAIQSGANMLLTFTGIRNEVGKGNDIFNQATQSSADMAAALGTDTKSAALQLGKALNDPIKGVGKLQRAGVTFTDQQKKQIETLQKSGDILGAQKIILGEVNKEFGGQAAATSTAGEKVATYVGNIKEQFGTILLPYMDKFAKFFLTTLGPAISTGVSKIGPIIGKIATFVGAGVKALGPVLAGIRTFIAPVVTAVQGLIAGITGGGGMTALTGFATGIQTVFATVLPIIRSVIVTVLGAIQQNLPQIKAIAAEIGAALKAIASIIQSVWSRLGPIILPIIKIVFTTVVGIVSGAIKVISGVLKFVAAILKGDWSGAWKAAGKIVSGVVGIIKSVLGGMRAQVGVIMGAVGGVVKSAWNAVKSATSAAWNAVKNAVTSGVTNAAAKVKALPGKLKSGLGNMAGLLVSAGKDAIRGFIDGMGRMLSSVVSKAKDIAHAALNAAKSALGIASPSKKFREIGKWVGDGLVSGLQGSSKKVQSTTRKLADQLIAGFRASGLSKKEATSRTKEFLKSVDAQTDDALRIARRREQISAQIKSLNKGMPKFLKELRASSDEYKKSLTDALQSANNITSIQTGDAEGNLSAGGIVQGMTDKLARLRDFASKLAKLRGAGLNGKTYDQLVQAGVDGGGAYVDALSSDLSKVGDVNALQKSLDLSAKTLGNYSGNVFYQSGLDAQKGLIAGLQAEDAQLKAAAKALAKTLSDEVKKALGIKSPSKVLAELGRYSIDGLIVGLDPKRVAAQGAKVAGSLVSGFGTPGLEAATGSAAAGGGRGGITIEKVILQVPRGATKAEIGRELVDYITSYNRESGR